MPCGRQKNGIGLRPVAELLDEVVDGAGGVGDLQRLRVHAVLIIVNDIEDGGFLFEVSEAIQDLPASMPEGRGGISPLEQHAL